MSPIIVVCGHSKFKQEILQVAKDLTLAGNVVLLPLVFSAAGDNITEAQLGMLIELHKQKIDMAKEVHIVTVNSFIGPNTKIEIEYAKSKNLPIVYHDFKSSPIVDYMKAIKEVKANEHL